MAYIIEDLGTEWRQLDFGGYEVSNTGALRRAVASRRTPAGFIINPVITHRGYLRYTLSFNGIKKNFVAHKLVAETFIGERPPGYTINHKDGNKFNNSVENLEYITNLENCQHAAKNGLMARGERHPNAKLSDRQVRQIKFLFYKGIMTASEISRAFNTSISNVSGIVKGRFRKPLAKPQAIEAIRQAKGVG